MAYTPPSIASAGGISKFLDNTASDHNGLYADKIKELWNWGKKPHVSVASLAVMTGVVWSTMDKWLDLLHEEAGIDRPRPKRPKV